MNSFTKRVKCMLVCAVMLLTLIPVVSFAGAGVAITATKANAENAAGTEVSIDLNMTENAGFCYMGIDVAFDNTALELVSVEGMNDLLDATYFASGSSSTPVDTANASGVVAMLWNGSLHTDSNFTKTGKVATLKFAVKSGATIGEKTISVNVSDGDPDNLYNIAEENVALAPTAGSVTLTQTLTAVALTDGITTPAKGMTNNSTVTGDNVTATVTFSPAVAQGSAFGQKTVYTATVNVKANTGYVFADNVTFSGLSGFSAFTKQSDGSYSATKTYPETANKDSAALNGVAIADWTYGETASTPTCDKPTGAGDVTYTYEGDNYPASTKAPTNAGSYKLTATCEDTDKIYTGTANFKINPAALPTTATAADTTYTGKAAAPTVTIEGLTAGTDFTVSCSAINAGSATATITGKGNYTGTTSASFTIKPVTVTLSAEKITKAYDGNGKLPAAKITVKGALGSDKVNLKDSSNTVEELKNYEAGEYSAVATLTSNELDNANYTLGTVKTCKVAVTITPVEKGAVADDAQGTVTVDSSKTEGQAEEMKLTVKPASSGSTVKTVFAYPAGLSAKSNYTYSLVLTKSDGTTETIEVKATETGLVANLKESGNYKLTWTSNNNARGSDFVVNGNGTGSFSGTSSGTLNVPTNLTGTIGKVTVDGKTLSANDYYVSGNTVVLTDAFMKTLGNGKHTVKVSDASKTYSASINVSGNATTKSAGTGDMGIVLYAALALTSATGAVWVSRKKED